MCQEHIKTDSKQVKTHFQDLCFVLVRRGRHYYENKEEFQIAESAVRGWSETA